MTTHTAAAAAAHRISALIERTRAAAQRSRRVARFDLLREARSIGVQLDAARTELVLSGLRYLPIAEAFEAASSVDVQHIEAQLDRLDQGVDRIAAERVDADGVLSWLDLHGIHLYPYQRRAVARLSTAAQPLSPSGYSSRP